MQTPDPRIGVDSNDTIYHITQAIDWPFEDLAEATDELAEIGWGLPGVPRFSLHSRSTLADSGRPIVHRPSPVRLRPLHLIRSDGHLLHVTLLPLTSHRNAFCYCCFHAYS